MIHDGRIGGVARKGVFLAAEPVGYDGYVLGHGIRLHDGSVKIKGYEVGGTDARIDDEFVQAYATLAGTDMAAQTFAARMSPVLRIPMEHYRALGKKTGYQLLELFEPRGIEHLLLAGLESAYGLAWLTLYRTTEKGKPAPQPFSLEDCETAMFSIRGALYAWQRAFLPISNEEVWGDFRFDLVQLPPAALEVAIRKARGYEQQEIADQLGISKETVKKHMGDAMEALGLKTREELCQLLLDRAMGPLPDPRSRRRAKTD